MAWVIKAWCKVMEVLERLRWHGVSYELAVVHCWCGMFCGKPIRECYTDLLLLLYYMLIDLFTG